MVREVRGRGVRVDVETGEVMLIETLKGVEVRVRCSLQLLAGWCV